MTGTDGSRPELGPEAGIDDIQADIERTRAELGNTVEALSAKADVTGRTKQKVVESRNQLAGKARDMKELVVDKTTDDTGSLNPLVPAAVAGVVALVVGLIIWRRRC